MHTIWPGRRVQQAKYENINNSNFDGMSLASFCQSRAVFSVHVTGLANEDSQLLERSMTQFHTPLQQ